ncbi:hypothetical protein HK100_004945 [Physocladia obscura]|uniref:Uncharacterized protein n=1 Tax=Physocladia obscura TaxID=109957 RepID=A0AAD5XCN7_9FUNG|nr:hypothetical protein HK100_004945 [Physocladia obscura]
MPFIERATPFVRTVSFGQTQMRFEKKLRQMLAAEIRLPPHAALLAVLVALILNTKNKQFKRLQALKANAGVDSTPPPQDRSVLPPQRAQNVSDEIDTSQQPQNYHETRRQYPPNYSYAPNHQHSHYSHYQTTLPPHTSSPNLPPNQSHNKVGSNQPIASLKPPPLPSLPQYPPYQYPAEHYRVEPVSRENHLYYYPPYSGPASATVYSQSPTAYGNYYTNGQGNHLPPPEKGYPENSHAYRPAFFDGQMNHPVHGQINRQFGRGKLSDAETLLRNVNQYSNESGDDDNSNRCGNGSSDGIFLQQEQTLEAKRALSGLDELATVALSYASEI